MFTAFPKIFSLGNKFVQDIFKEDVEITEKVDGSQISFGKINDDVIIRSKKQQLFIDNPEKMFAKGVEYIASIANLLPEGIVFYGEYLQKEKHNVLTYQSIPKNHIALFGAMDYKDKSFSDYQRVKELALALQVDVVPILYYGSIKNVEDIKEFLKMKSFLGGPEVEGVVIKNYYRPNVIGGTVFPITSAKLVSEGFKERHKIDWAANTGKNKWETYKESFASEARWNKAIQRMKEEGIHTGSPKDIGKLMQYVQQDIYDEEKENIKDFLWGLFGKDLMRAATKNLPEWYKASMVKEMFENGQ